MGKLLDDKRCRTPFGGIKVQDMVRRVGKRHFVFLLNQKQFVGTHER